MKKLLLGLVIILLLSYSAFAANECGTSSPYTCSTWAELKSCVEGSHEACGNWVDGSTINIDANITAASRIDITDPMIIDAGGRCNDRDETTDGCGEVAQPGGTWTYTVTGPGSGDATDDWGLIIAADSADDVIEIAGFHFIGTWTSGRNTHSDYGAIGIGSANKTPKWRIHDNKWSGTGLKMGLHKITQGGLIYKNFFHITAPGGTIYIIRVKDIEGSQVSTSTSGGYTTRLFYTETPDWGGSKGTFFEDNSFSQDDWSDSGGTIDMVWGAKIIIRHNYFMNGWVSSHGCTNGTVMGSISWEIYSNTFDKTVFMAQAVSVRSGTGLIYDNFFSTAASGWSEDAFIKFADESQRISGTPSFGSPTEENAWDGTGTSGDGYAGYPYYGQPAWPQASGYTYNIALNTSDVQPLTLWPYYIADNTGETRINDNSNYMSLGVEYYNCVTGCDSSDYPLGYVAYTYPHPDRSADAAPPNPIQSFDGVSVSELKVTENLTAWNRTDGLR